MKLNLLLLSITLNSVFFCSAQNAGNALNFDGTDAYCTSILPTVFNSISTNDFTIECWVKIETSAVSKRVFSAQNDANNFCSILINSTNTPYFFLRDNGTTYSVNTQVNLLTTVWNHLAFKWDASTNTITSYVNGLQVNGLNGGSSSIGIDNVMTIGARTDGQQVYKGSIDELRIWDDLRTPCEIYAGMNTNFTTGQPNLVAAYSFDQGIANGTNTGVTTLTDLNNLYNATLTNFALSGSSSNWVSSDVLISESNNNSETRLNTDVITVCDSYTWSDGNTYTSSSNTATYTNTTNNCECINNLDLTVNYTSTGTDVVSACESYTWIDNVTYTSSNNSATFVLTNASGCDSLVTLDLTINPVLQSTDVISACNSYTWIDGNTYTSSNNTATHTLVGGSVHGCDSTVTLNLTINQPVTGIDLLTACNSFTWIDGNTYTSNNNTATYTLIGGSVYGCDSTVTLNLTILPTSSGTDVQTACISFTWIDGTTYTSSNNTATYTLVGGATNGCDSVIALNLTIDSMPDVTTTTSGLMISVAQSGALYQWLDCNNGNAPISGEIFQNFLPDVNGSYAVLVENGVCSSISECVLFTNISSASIDELNVKEVIRIFPNPSNGIVQISTNQALKSIHIYDLQGSLLFQENVNFFSLDLSMLSRGVYIVHFMNINGTVTTKRLEKY